MPVRKSKERTQRLERALEFVTAREKLVQLVGQFGMVVEESLPRGRLPAFGGAQIRGQHFFETALFIEGGGRRGHRSLRAVEEFAQFFEAAV